MTQNSAPRVAITGAGGQLGLQCRARLSHHHGLDIVAIDRKTFEDERKLSEAVGTCDAVIHLAGINRANDEDLLTVNQQIARRLTSACELAGVAPAVAYASTIHVQRPGAYGKGKAEAGELLERWCSARGAPFRNIVLPNLFGEFSRPDYNNVVGTFCRRIADGLSPDIHADAPLALLHYREAADVFFDAVKSMLEDGASREVHPTGHPTTVGTIADRIAEFAEIYRGRGEIPHFVDGYDLDLFNAFRDALFPSYYPARLVRHADPRGSFFECVRANGRGQTSFSTTAPGVTRGNHFHFTKVERFLVVSGSARISVRRLYSDEVHHFDVSGEEPAFVDMPTLHTHAITNTGDGELLTLFWINAFFDPDNADTYVEMVE